LVIYKNMRYICGKLGTHRYITQMQTKSAHNLMPVSGANLIVFNALNLNLSLQRYKKHSCEQTGVIACLSVLLKTFFRQLSVWKKVFLITRALKFISAWLP